MVEEAEADQGGDTAQDAGTGRKRGRTLIEFPYTDISRASELTGALAEAGGKVWIDQTQLAVTLDMSASGGTFRGRLSAARMFGFIETEGGKVRLSDLGLHLLDSGTERGALGVWSHDVVVRLTIMHCGRNYGPGFTRERQND